LIIFLSFLLVLARFWLRNYIYLVLLIIFINFIFKSGMKTGDTSLNLTWRIIFHKSFGDLINFLLLIIQIFIFNNYQVINFFIQILNHHHLLIWSLLVITWDLIRHLLKFLEIFRFVYFLFFRFNLQTLFSLFIFCFILDVNWEMLVIVIIILMDLLGNLLIIVILLQKIILLKFDLIIFDLLLNFKFLTLRSIIFIFFKVCLFLKCLIRT
jgi:hypothetical protein